MGKVNIRRILKITLLSIIALALLTFTNIVVTRKLNRDLLEVEYFNAPNKNNNPPILVPSTFINGERFYIKIPLKNGDTLDGFGDTGGGLSMILPTTIKNKNLKSKVKTGILKGIMPLDYVLCDDLLKDPNFPMPFPLRSFVIRSPFTRVVEPYLVVPRMDDEIQFFMQSMPGTEVFLGQGFFKVGRGLLIILGTKFG